MEKQRTIPTLVIASFIALSGGVTQEQNIEQTVDYINDAIDEDPYYGGKERDIEFEVDDEGKLTAQYYWGSYEAFKHTMPLKELDKSKVKRDTTKIYGRDIIELHCHEGSNCIKMEKNHKRKTREKRKYEFSVTNTERAARRVQNAFIHLIERAEKRYENGSSDKSKDPYDY